MSRKSRNHNSKNTQQNKVSRIELTRREVRISSPIPPVEIMKEYENLAPNATDRFLRLAENQSEHRQKLELMNEQGQRRRAMLGLIAAWSITILVVIVGGYLILNDKNITGLILIIGAMGSRVLSLFISKIDRKKDLDSHR